MIFSIIVVYEQSYSYDSKEKTQIDTKLVAQNKHDLQLVGSCLNEFLNGEITGEGEDLCATPSPCDVSFR